LKHKGNAKKIIRLKNVREGNNASVVQKNRTNLLWKEKWYRGDKKEETMKERM